MHWGVEGDRERHRRAGGLSLALHVAVTVTLFLLPADALKTPPRPERKITPLIAPFEITQPDPNKGKISKEITADALIPRPRIQIPAGAPSTTRAAAQTPSPRALALPPAPKPAPTVAPMLPDAPKIESNERLPQGMNPNLTAENLPPPPPPAAVKPKIAFETPGSPSSTTPRPGGQIAVPSASVGEAVRATARGGGGGLTVGDTLGVGVGGVGEMLNAPPSPGRQASALELLSDPQGVDFRPYLSQILFSVRKNWFAVMPESAKLGHRGRVTIQFSVDRSGRVPKLVIASGSGLDALDRAAVAGISASNPFPPLPTEFKGNLIRLQFVFQYNMPSR